MLHARKVKYNRTNLNIGLTTENGAPDQYWTRDREQTKEQVQAEKTKSIRSNKIVANSTLGWMFFFLFNAFVNPVCAKLFP